MFDYIKTHYNVPADLHREVFVDGKKGVIVKDMGNYIGVSFYDTPSPLPKPCHPTWKVEYLETFNQPPKVTPSKQRYLDWLYHSNGTVSFAEWLGIKKQ